MKKLYCTGEPAKAAKGFVEDLVNSHMKKHMYDHDNGQSSTCRLVSNVELLEVVGTEIERLQEVAC